MENTAIAIENLKFSYGRTRVLDGLSLHIPAGISFGLLGANGSGKTTLIRLMVGLLKPASGLLTCLGKRPSPAIARQIGYMPQLASLYNELTVEQNIDFFAHIYGMRDRKQRIKRVDEVIRVIDLVEKKHTPILKLSGGMKQRVSLGCAIVHSPLLLFLDEPTVGLDPDVRARFWEFFNGLTAGGATLVITSHTLDDAAHCRRLAFLRNGRIIALGSPAELQSATGDPHATLEETFLYFVKHSEEEQNGK
ncbi:MAG: ABC transporter ATP-binding protein [Dehalococcoidales bacterium]|nr:ABC transporter ATP-binding protein [Dehalococcoidales bacterium]